MSAFNTVRNDIGSLLLRIALGVMYVAHGYTKLFIWGPENTAAYFASIGMPAIIAYGTIAFELLGGFCFLGGFLTRVVAALAFIQMIVIVGVHFPNGFIAENPNGGWEYPAFMLLAAGALFFFGGGRFSVPWLRKFN